MQVGCMPSNDAEYKKHCEMAFRTLQNGIDPKQDEFKQSRWPNTRSMMVGDIVEFENGKMFFCDACGWAEIDLTFFELWKKVDSRDRHASMFFYSKYIISQN